MNVYLPFTPRLPNTYQEVEYIQSTGTQYINTWFIPNQKTKVDIWMSWFSVFQRWESLFWVRYSWSADASVWRWFWLVRNTIDNTTWAMFGRKYTWDWEWMWWYTFHDWNYHTINMSQSWIYEDWILRTTLNTVTFTSPSNLYIFVDNDNGTINEQWAFKLYYFKIRDNWTLVRNFIPCYRKSDNVIWLYDLVNSAFYTNAWSWTFSKGNDVTMAELKNAYIWEFVPYTPWENTIARYQFKSDIKNHYWSDADWYVYSWNVSYENNMMKYTWQLRKNKATLSWWYSWNFTVLSWRKREWTDARIDLWRADFSMNSWMSIPWWNAELCSVYAWWSWYAISLPQMTNWVHLFAMVRNWNTLYWYLDWNLIWSKSISWSLNSTLSCWAISWAWWTVWETIAENKARNQTGIQSYYNNTKSNYWL